MSYIIRKGNLATAPELKQGPQRVYTHARVLVTDTERDRETGQRRLTALKKQRPELFADEDSQPINQEGK